jgi:acetylornithine deacetylase/succinyl-diaminopimelate desuccinylase-like protein
MDVIELTKKLISMESITGNEQKIAEFIASQLDLNDVKMQPVSGFGPNVIAMHIEDFDKPTVLLNCHMDTVEVMQGWEHDPLKPRMDGNKLFGLGACDMKAGCAIAIDVFNTMVKKKKNIIFTAVADEEGNSKGSFVLLKKLLNEELKDNIAESLCLIPEDTQEIVKLGARGRYVIEIMINGCSAHGATPECGTNAVTESARILSGLDGLPLTTHPVMGTGSLCVLKIQGGGDSLSVPDRCAIRVDRHTVPGETKGGILKDFNELIKNLNIPCECDISLMKRETPFLEPYIVDTENPWAKRFLSAFLEFYEKEPEIGYGRSVGDFNAFGKVMPTIVFGPMGANFHSPNEFVYVDSIRRTRDFYLRFIEGLE